SRLPPPKSTAGLFDHLVGGEQELWRNFEADRLCGLEIDDQIEFDRPQHRQVGRLLALQDATDVDADLAERVRKARAVARESAGRCIKALGRDRGDRMAQRQRGDLLAPADEQGSLATIMASALASA